MLAQSGYVVQAQTEHDQMTSIRMLGKRPRWLKTLLQHLLRTPPLKLLISSLPRTQRGYHLVSVQAMDLQEVKTGEDELRVG